MLMEPLFSERFAMLPWRYPDNMPNSPQMLMKPFKVETYSMLRQQTQFDGKVMLSNEPQCWRSNMPRTEMDVLTRKLNIMKDYRLLKVGMCSISGNISNRVSDQLSANIGLRLDL